MKWSDFQKALEKKGLTQAEFSRLTGYSEQTISRWQHNANGVPKWARTWLGMHRADKVAEGG